jgi:hypothetical protein
MTDQSVKKLVGNSTRTTTYLLPLLSKTIGVDYRSHIRNCYIFFNDDIGVNYPVGVVYDVTDFASFEEFNMYDEMIKSSAWYRENYSFNEDMKLYVFECPDQWKSDYDLFVEGQYSKMSKDAKKTILSYTTLEYKYQPLIDDMAGILYKRRDRKEKLEKILAMTIPDDLELASKIDPEQETFKFEWAK